MFLYVTFCWHYHITQISEKYLRSDTSIKWPGRWPVELRAEDLCGGCTQPGFLAATHAAKRWTCAFWGKESGPGNAAFLFISKTWSCISNLSLFYNLNFTLLNWDVKRYYRSLIGDLKIHYFLTPTLYIIFPPGSVDISSK